MNLLDEIKKLFGELKDQLAGSTKPADHTAQLTAFEGRIKACETLAEKSAKDIEAKDGEITKLKGTIADLEGKVTAKDKEIADLKASAKSAGEQAANIVAATGIDAKEVPEAKPQDGTAKGGAAKSLKEQWKELAAKDSIAAARFYKMHSKKPEFWQ